jgi:hypothetical protein
MDQVVRAVHPLLREQGFKKQRHSFSREGGEGITHALQFQMGRYEPHPDRRPGYYGAFTVELGVYVGAVAELFGQDRPRFIRAHDCHFRERAGTLLDGDDTWWTLDQPLDDLADGMLELVTEVALPWFGRLDSLDGILDAWHAGNLGSMFALEVTVAMLHYARGDREVAEQIIRAELGRTQRGAYAENLIALVQPLGMELSMDDAKVVNLLEAERREWT